VLRLLDARTGSPAEVRPARRGVLRVCAHAPQAAAQPDITALRVLLTADLLARAAELRGMQVLTAVQLTGASPAQAAAVEGSASVLGIHPPAFYGSCRDAPSSLGGPADVHLLGQGASMEPGQAGLLVTIGAARLDTADGHPDAAAGGPLTGHRHDPLAVRLALMSFPGQRPAALADGELGRADETVARWRQLVARWAESPSRPVPAAIAGTMREAFGGLDIVAVLALLRGLPADANVPAGAKFETFVYADRILGLDLARDIGR
jgi:hypothetical protein